jgi:hypothetical protein
MSTDDWATDLAGQIVEVSHIARRKHALIGHAAVWMAWSLVAWAVGVVFLTLSR